MTLWHVLVYIQVARICHEKRHQIGITKLNDPIYQSEIHFLAEMSIATATLASRIALGLLAHSIRGKATSRSSNDDS